MPVVYALSKCFEAIRANTPTAAVTAKRRMFATHVIPETIASDNGTVFVFHEVYTNIVTNKYIGRIAYRKHQYIRVAWESLNNISVSGNCMVLQTIMIVILS